ncbi:adenine nucleotide alpha hydrolase family protein [Candidatus Woesearchaeota archaeon]|nr:adenine nucleotide alpha hydrolase family protein [Candidatus Woesearchaeota archaeon]
MQYVKEFEAKVRKTIKEYALCSRNEKIFVACSGGKDSTAALYILKKAGYDVEGMMIDLKMGDWSQRNLGNLKGFCDRNKIKLNIIDIRKEHGSSICFLRSGIQERGRIGNCTICGVVRRWILNKKARELGAAKLVTGHNLDDEAENVMMNLLKGKPELFMNMGPKTGMIEDAGFVQRVKPLYFCTNAEIRKYTEEMGWDREIVYEPCPCSVGAFRRDVRAMLSELEKKCPKVKHNLVAKLIGMLPKIKERYGSSSNLKYCRVCGEPSRNDICRRCQLMKVMVR